jgi:predicted nucleic acid-binding protein
MRRVFVDANVFLRFFTVDDEGQHQKAVRLLNDGAAGRIVMVSGPTVLFEVAWTMWSAYGVAPLIILDTLESIAGFPGLFLSDVELVLAAVSLARESGVGFADAYIAVSSQAMGVDQVATFNVRDFKRMDIATYAM